VLCVGLESALVFVQVCSLQWSRSVQLARETPSISVRVFLFLCVSLSLSSSPSLLAMFTKLALFCCRACEMSLLLHFQAGFPLFTARAGIEEQRHTDTLIYFLLDVSSLAYAHADRHTDRKTER
jgi:hypothetical protein